MYTNELDSEDKVSVRLTKRELSLIAGALLLMDDWDQHNGLLKDPARAGEVVSPMKALQRKIEGYEVEGWEAYGKRRGSCGHWHPTKAEARRCAKDDRLKFDALKRDGLVLETSDRRVRRIGLDDEEGEIL